MYHPKIEHPETKSGLHVRNRHRNRYDFKLLANCLPELAPFIQLNRYHDESIDFFNPIAVKTLNKALLRFYYDIGFWDIPPNYLCPPIPGRADYLHHAADLLAGSNDGIIPTGQQIKCLDIGVGANCVYPIIGNKEYGWSFTGTETDPVAFENAGKIVELNPHLKGKIDIRQQNIPGDIFCGIIQKNEYFDLTICNPPFHRSLAEARLGTIRKLNNLNSAKVTQPVMNFGGQNGELWCEGGEERFVKKMISQSKQFAASCFWFSTLISKQSTLGSIHNELKKITVSDVRTIPMSQGNKKSRIVAWTFLTPEQQKTWIKRRWI